MSKLHFIQKDFLFYLLRGNRAITRKEREMVERILSNGIYEKSDRDLLNDLRYIFQDTYIEERTIKASSVHMKQKTK